MFALNRFTEFMEEKQIREKTPEQRERGEKDSIGEPESATETKGILGGAITLAAGTGFSRILGLIREVIIANFFGTTGMMDAFVTANKIPNLARRILGEKAVESAFLPLFRTHATSKRPGKARALSIHVTMALLFIGVLFCVAAWIWTPELVRMMACGFDPGESRFAAAVNLTRIMLPLVLLVSLVSVAGAILQAYKLFGVYSFSPVAWNVGIIGTVILGARHWGIYSLAVGFLAGTALQGVAMLPSLLRKMKGSPGNPADRKSEIRDLSEIKKAGKLAVPIYVESGIEKIGTVIDNTLASLLSTGSVAALNYGLRLVNLPLGFIALAISRATAPYLIDKAASRQDRDFSEGVAFSLRANLFLMMPMTATLMLLAEPIAALLFERGQFTSQSTQMTAWALSAYSAGLFAMGIQTLLSRAFYARLTTRIPLLCTAISLTINIVLSLCLYRTSLQHAGLALATSISYWLNVLLLYHFLQKQTTHKIRTVRDVIAPGAKIIVGSVMAGLVMRSVFSTLDNLPFIAGFALQAAILGISIILGWLVYFAFIRIFADPQLYGFWRRRRRSK